MRKLIAAWLLAAAAFAGCGSSSDPSADFKKGFDAQGNTLEAQAKAIARALQGAATQNDAQVHTTFAALAKSWQDNLSKLQTLKPPSSAQADFNSLTSAATRVETDLNNLVAAATTHDASAGRQGGASTVTDLLAVKDAATKVQSELAKK